MANRGLSEQCHGCGGYGLEMCATCVQQIRNDWRANPDVANLIDTMANMTACKDPTCETCAMVELARVIRGDAPAGAS